MGAMTEQTLRAADLQGVSSDDFEKLTFLLARNEDSDVVIVRNKDRGLDARLPDPMGRLTLRGWQAKRFATGKIQWPKCEKSVRTALAFWRPLHITFVFAHDLSAEEQADFQKRIVEAFPVVRLSYWSAEEVLRRLRDTEDGRRAKVWLFGRSLTFDELLVSMVGKEPVQGAREIAERQAELNKQFDNDPHLYYTAVVTPDGAPETPSAPQAVASVMLSIDGQEVRYDLSERYPGALGDLGGGPRLVLRDDEQGEQARATLQAADNATGHVEIEGGTGVLWPEVPVGLRGLLPEQPLWGGATIIPMEVDELPPPDPVLLALIIAGSTELAVRFVQAEEPLPGWDGTMIGSTGGLELTQSARMHDGKLMLDQLGWRHNLGVGTATEQHLSAKLLLAALEGDEVVIEIGGDEGEVGRAWLALNDHSSDEEDIANLRTHVSFLEYACEVQAWLGVPLFPPARVSKEDTTELGRALGMIRQPQATGTWTDIQLSTDTNHPVADEGEVEVVIFQPVLAKFFGVEQYIGMEALHFDSVTVHRDGHSTVLRPGNNNAVTTELLHPDKMSVEAARQGSSGRGGRVLFKPAGADPDSDRGAHSG